VSTPARVAISRTARTKSTPRGGGARVHVGGPERRLAAVDEEAPGRGAVGDHPLGADAEDAVGRLLVRSHPAEPVALPAELGEGLVQALLELRQDDLDVEVLDGSRLHPQCPFAFKKASSAAAVISHWWRPSWGAALRSRSSSSGGSRVENWARTTRAARLSTAGRRRTAPAERVGYVIHSGAPDGAAELGSRS
jgi:hypothetical protein